MIVISNPVAKVLAIRLSGTVEESDVETMETAFEDQLDSDDRFGLVVDMSDWTDITVGALKEDAKFEFGLLSKLNRFPRMALISDKKFPQAVAKFFDPLIPAVQMRTFTSSQREEAITFASAPADPPAEPRHRVTVLHTGNPQILGFEIEGRLSKGDMERIVEPLQRAYEREEKIDLIVVWKNYQGFDPSMIVDKSVISMKLSSMSHIRRYAVVGGPGWMKNVAETVASVLPVDVRVFGSDDEDDAWAWLKSATSASG